MKLSAAEYFQNISPIKGENRRSKSNFSNKIGSGRCHCCPYGYHIDLDFVRYCQTLYQGAKNASPSLVELKRMKKARRRETHSVEAMLGIPAGEDHLLMQQQKDRSYGKYRNSRSTYHAKKSTPPPPPPRKQSLEYQYNTRSPQPPDLIRNSNVNERSEAASEALQEAVQDFESILESSKSIPGGRKGRPGNSHLSIDLLHHTSLYPSEPCSRPGHMKMAGTQVVRSSSLPRHSRIDSTSFSRLPQWNQKESYYGSQNQNFLALNKNNPFREYMMNDSPHYGVFDEDSRDFDTMSVSSAMSGVSTVTLQSIRDQMATGLSRLKDLEEEVKSFPNILIKLDILREEKRILIEELRNAHHGTDISQVISVCADKNQDFAHSRNDLELRLETLRKFASSRHGRGSGQQRNRSCSPMRVNLQEFKSYRRAGRRSSMSDGSDTENSYSNRHPDIDQMSLFINERNDDELGCSRVPSNKKKHGRTSYKSSRDVAVGHEVRKRDVGVSSPAPPSRSIGISTEHSSGFDEYPSSAESCIHCLRRQKKTFENRCVGPNLDDVSSQCSSVSPLSVDSIEIDPVGFEKEGSPSRSFVLEEMSKKSPIIDRLSAPQAKPPVITFDNSTNTEPLVKSSQFSNTSLKMGDLFTSDQLNDLLADAKQQWLATHVSSGSHVEKFTLNKSTQVVKRHNFVDKGCQATERKSGVCHAVGVTVKPLTNDIGIQFDSPEISEVYSNSTDQNHVEKKSVGVGKSFSDGPSSCPDCAKKKFTKFRSVGSGHFRLTDIACEKCENRKVRSIAIGDGRITDEFCEKCKVKKCSSFCQTLKSTCASVSCQTNSISLENNQAGSPYPDQQPFGVSGVQICDKCHEEITSVAKNMVNVTGPSIPSSDKSKIPRIVGPTDVAAEIRSGQSRNLSSSSARNSSMSRPSQLSALPEEFRSKKCIPYMNQEPLGKERDTGKYGDTVLQNLAIQGDTQRDTSSALPDRFKIPKSQWFNSRKTARSKPASSRSSNASSSKQERELEERPNSCSTSSSDAEEGTDVMSTVTDNSTLATNVTSSTASILDGDQRKKSQPSRGMRAALKVLNDSVGKPVRSSQQLTNALNIIQKEWFKVSSSKDVNSAIVEEYLDAFEDYSRGVLQRVVNLADVNGNTAMHYAVSLGNFDVVSILLDSKVCCVNLQNKAGYTAVMLVALTEMQSDTQKGIVKRLFESGDVNIKASQHGQTALMLAVSHGRFDMVRMLIAAGADPNIQDEDGSSALMCSAEHGHLAIVRFLMAQPDTDLYLMDNDGSTALTIAVEAGHKDVGVLLYKQMNLSRGASPHSSFRGAKRSQIPLASHSSASLPPRSSAPASPGRSRKSSGRASPASDRHCSASLSNLIL